MPPKKKKIYKQQQISCNFRKFHKNWNVFVALYFCCLFFLAYKGPALRFFPLHLFLAYISARKSRMKMQFSKAKQTLVDMLPKRERGRSRTGVEILINKPGNFGNFRQLALGLPPPLDKPQNQRAKGSWNFSCCHKKLHMHGTHPPCAPSLNPLSTKSKAGQVRQTFALEKAQKRSQRRRKGKKNARDTGKVHQEFSFFAVDF